MSADCPRCVTGRDGMVTPCVLCTAKEVRRSFGALRARIRERGDEWPLLVVLLETLEDADEARDLLACAVLHVREPDLAAKIHAFIERKPPR